MKHIILAGLLGFGLSVWGSAIELAQAQSSSVQPYPAGTTFSATYDAFGLTFPLSGTIDGTHLKIQTQLPISGQIPFYFEGVIVGNNLQYTVHQSEPLGNEVATGTAELNNGVAQFSLDFYPKRAASFAGPDSSSRYVSSLIISLPPPPAATVASVGQTADRRAICGNHPGRAKCFKFTSRCLPKGALCLFARRLYRSSGCLAPVG